MKKYIKQNNDPLEIEDGLYTEDDKDIYGDGEEVYLPSFYFAYTRYFLKDFIRTHNNPWVSDNFPSYIHGYSSTCYSAYAPIYIELVDDAHVNVYEYIDEDIKPNKNKYRVWVDAIDHMYIDIAADSEEEARLYADDVVDAEFFHLKGGAWNFTKIEKLQDDAKVDFTCDTSKIKK